MLYIDKTMDAIAFLVMWLKTDGLRQMATRLFSMMFHIEFSIQDYFMNWELCEVLASQAKHLKLTVDSWNWQMNQIGESGDNLQIKWITRQNLGEFIGSDMVKMSSQFPKVKNTKSDCSCDMSINY